MKKLILFGFTTLLFCSNISAQLESDSTSNKINGIVKFSPVSAINIPFSSAQFAFEQSLNERTSLQYEFGIGLIKKTSLLGTVEGNRAIRGIVEVRRYKLPLTYDRNTFQSIGIRYQHRNLGEQTYYYHQGLYTDVLLLPETHSTFGIYYSRGWHWIYDNGFSMELGGALGVQNYKISLNGLPNEIEPNRLEKNVLIALIGVGNNILPIAFLVFKMGYAF